MHAAPLNPARSVARRLLPVLGAALLGACSEAQDYDDSADPWAGAGGGAASLDPFDAGAGASALLINELLADSAEGPDWVELYNPTDAVVALGALRLGDSATIDEAWAPPADLGLEPGGHLVIQCDGDDGYDEEGALHAAFKLSKDGEVLRLWSEDGAMLDEVAFPAAEADESYGRVGDGAPDWAIFAPPTPGATNAQGEG